jgi:hypothetical protein
MEWKTKVLNAKIKEFNTVVYSLELHLYNILNSLMTEIQMLSLNHLTQK